MNMSTEWKLDINSVGEIPSRIWSRAKRENMHNIVEQGRYEFDGEVDVGRSLYEATKGEHLCVVCDNTLHCNVMAGVIPEIRDLAYMAGNNMHISDHTGEFKKTEISDIGFLSQFFKVSLIASKFNLSNSNYKVYLCGLTSVLRSVNCSYFVEKCNIKLF
jgi:hypothetical protein